MSTPAFVSVEELKAMQGQKNLVVVDCRYSLHHTASGRHSYEDGHIPGAYYAHVNDDLSGTIIPGRTGRHPLPEPRLFARFLGRIGVTPETHVVVYDEKSNGIAGRLWWMLKWIGHDKVSALDGGWQAWLAAGEAEETELPPVQKETVELNLQHHMVATLKEVLEQAGTNACTLVDSRTAPRYKGIHEPIDHLAGHIPAALNHSYIGNSDAEGKSLSKTELADSFESVVQGRAISDLIFYCGSGVTACNNILHLYHASGELARLYPGSWSEYIWQPTAKIATAADL